MAVAARAAVALGWSSARATVAPPSTAAAANAAAMRLRVTEYIVVSPASELADPAGAGVVSAGGHTFTWRDRTRPRRGDGGPAVRSRERRHGARLTHAVRRLPERALRSRGVFAGPDGRVAARVRLDCERPRPRRLEPARRRVRRATCEAVQCERAQGHSLASGRDLARVGGDGRRPGGRRVVPARPGRRPDPQPALRG